MTQNVRVLQRNLLDVLSDQPNVGLSVFLRTGEVTFCNPTARQLFYGSDQFDPVGKTVADIEGETFAAEVMPLIERVCATRLSVGLQKLRGGRLITSIGWPVRTSADVSEDHADAVLVMTVPGSLDDETMGEVDIVQSQLASWGFLAPLTNRELQVLEAIGRGLSQKEIAEELDITRKTVETHRARIGNKLEARSSTELARIACESGFRTSDIACERHDGRVWMNAAISTTGTHSATETRSTTGTHAGELSSTSHTPSASPDASPPLN